MNVAHLWAESDLVRMVKLGDFHAEDLTFPDWGMVVGLLGEAGSATSQLASASLIYWWGATVYARRHAWAGNNWREWHQGHRAQNASFEKINPAIVADWEESSARLESEVKRLLLTCVDGLEDAIRCAPQGSEETPIPFHRLRSEVARELKAAYDKSRGENTR